jgi:hypothetical protein
VTTGTVLIDGTDIRSAGVRLLRGWEEALAVPDLRGDDITVSDSDGDTWVDERPFSAFTFNLPLALRGSSQATFNDARRALARLVKPDGTITLTRRLPFTGGDEDHTATGRYVGGLQPSQMYAMIDGDFTLSLKNLSGLWYGPSATVSATGAVTVLGDVRTRRMVITLTGGTNPTLTNTTTGDSLTWTGTVGGTPIVIDNQTITALQGATNVTGALSHSRTYPMTLKAGSNTLALTGGGSFSIAYYPAYL